MAKVQKSVLAKKATHTKRVPKPTLTQVRRWIQNNDAVYLQEIINKPADK